jgi:Fe-S-cluster-containing dehydrogenase component
LPISRALIPLREPHPGEQYAFEVDLDRCSGCKACVTACHSMNGLDEGETWRSVGLLQRAEPELSPAQQHVTTACHHCLEPGCAQGCPTQAYEKDPVTGVVRHLDDQCFGCQYCVLKCPYDVPQYNAKKGVVRKCDLCVGRLREGEAPACAQACPTRAIRVTVVEAAAVRRAPEAAFDLPGTPDPARVLPTTRYVSKRGLPARLVPADASQVRPEPAHLPLVFMLVASQAAA